MKVGEQEGLFALCVGPGRGVADANPCQCIYTAGQMQNGLKIGDQDGED